MRLSLVRPKILKQESKRGEGVIWGWGYKHYKFMVFILKAFEKYAEHNLTTYSKVHCFVGITHNSGEKFVV